MNIQRNLTRQRSNADNIQVTEEEIEEAYQAVDAELAGGDPQGSGQYPCLIMRNRRQNSWFDSRGERNDAWVRR